MTLAPRSHLRAILALRSALAATVFLLGSLAWAQGGPGRAASAPNIVFIMADDLGYSDLGSYGGRKIRTPHLDRLAAQGTRYTDVYAGASVCAPSRCVLMTGLHTGHSLIRGNSPRVGGRESEVGSFGRGGSRISMGDRDRTVAEVLQAAGYVTGAIGKWGLGEIGSDGVPNRRGFTEWFGFLNQNHAPDYYTDYLWRNDRKQPIPENEGGKRVRYAHDLLTDEAVAFLRRRQRERFFLYLPFTLPHRRFEVPALEGYEKEDWPEEARIYAAMVTRLDRDVGRVLGEIDALGLAQNTLVIFTSDNGAERRKTFPDVFASTGPFRGEKGTLFEGGLRVPAIVRWPGVTPAGRVSAARWWFPDVFPTLAGLAGSREGTSKVDGLDIAATLRGREQPELVGRTLYWEDHDDVFSQAAIRGRWKVLREGNLKAPLKLYDLESDVGETRDVAARHPAIVSEFERYLAGARTPSAHWPVEP